MATSDKLNYLIGTKNAIKEAIVEKGVDVSNSDAFRSYAEKIKSISAGGGGGGDKVYATNRTELQPAGKVLIKKGQEGDTELETTIEGTSSSLGIVMANVFYNDNSLFTGLNLSTNVFKRFDFLDNTWQPTNATYLAKGVYFDYEYLNNGVITLSPYVGYGESTTGALGFMLTENGMISSGSGKYLGEYNGIHYATTGKDNDVYVYDIENKVATSTQAINGPNNRRSSFLRGNKIMLNSSSNRVTLYENVDGTYTKYCDSDLGVAVYFLAVTGLEIGDYLIGTDNYSAYYNYDISTRAYLKIYQIQEALDYTGTGYSARIVEANVPALEWLKTTDCRFTYDIRHNTLLVGTKTGVFGYEFSNGEFKDIGLNLGLPTIYMGDIYRAVMSPNKNKILVTLPVAITTDTTTYTSRIKVFRRAEEGWAIIDNKTLNYQPQSTYTGMATGYINEDGKYEVRVLLDESDKELA